MHLALKSGHSNAMPSLDFASEEPSCSIYHHLEPLILQICLTYILTDVFRTTQCLSVPKIKQTAWFRRFDDEYS